MVQEQDMLGQAELVRQGQVSPSELLEQAIERAEALNPQYNFLAHRHYDHGRAAIARGLPDGPFRGVPFLLKDVEIYLAGTVTSNGSRFFLGDVASESSVLTRRYEAAGLVIFGKTTTPELALRTTTESAAYGQTRNPWNPEHTSGGSSGGAAVAVATGVVAGAHGTDAGGSIRIPSSCCGLFGMKPSRGRIPPGPHRLERMFGFSTSHALTRSVRDSAALLDASCGIEPGAWSTAPAPERPFPAEATREPGRLRIALQTAVPGAAIDPECVAAAKAAAQLCESLGHHVEEAAPPVDMRALRDAQMVLSSALVAADLSERSRVSGIEPGPDVLEETTRTFLGMGLQVSGLDCARADYMVQEAAVAMARFMERYDVLLSPTLGSPPPKLGFMEQSAKTMEDYAEAIFRFIPFTQLMNLTGQPSMSVPLAMSGAGLPIGVMFSARYGDEACLYRLAGQLERAAPWAGRRPVLMG